MHVLQLPVDILIAIFSHLTASRDLYSCNQVCRAVHNLFRSSPQLYHKLSLARASLADTLYGVQNKSLQDRTRLVLELEQRWWSRALSSRRQLKIPLDNPCIEYQICNGVIVTGVLSSTGDSLQELQVYRLPSYLTGLKSKLWRHKLEKDSSVRQLKVDPSQDLLVLTGVGPPDSGDLGIKCTVSLHLRTLSTNDNHPAASLATLSLKGVLPTQPFMHPYSQGRIVVRICQDILGVLTNPDSTDPVTESSVQSLVIWQWTSGQQILTLPRLDNLLINDLTFLGRHTILLTHSTTPNGPGISVLHLALGQPYANSPVTSTAPMDSLETSTFFHFPSPPICSHECIRMGSIKITSEPPIDISWPALEGKNHVPRVFTPDPSEATSIVAFSLSIYVRAFGSTRTNTIKHTLLTRASVFSTCTAPYSKRFYTFDEWSSEDTYWFSGEPGFIHGQRYTLTSFQQPRTNVEIYDFNPCHAEIPDSGWFALLKEGNSKLAHGIVPKLGAHRTRCGHKRYLESELKSTMHCKRQCMKAGLARLHDRVISALDGENVITVEFERGGLVRGFVAYNI